MNKSVLLPCKKEHKHNGQAKSVLFLSVQRFHSVNANNFFKGIRRLMFDKTVKKVFIVMVDNYLLGINFLR